MSLDTRIGRLEKKIDELLVAQTKQTVLLELHLQEQKSKSDSKISQGNLWFTAVSAASAAFTAVIYYFRK